MIRGHRSRTHPPFDKTPHCRQKRNQFVPKGQCLECRGHTQPSLARGKTRCTLPGADASGAVGGDGVSPGLRRPIVQLNDIRTSGLGTDQQAPSLMMLTLHDMDVAHSGAYSLYIDAIRRADRLCAELWQAVQTHPEYRDRTTVYIMPDFGRDADDDPSGNGFQHHRTGSDMARTTWLLAMGPHIRQNVVVERPIESIDMVPTVGCRLGFSTDTPGRCIEELR